MAEPNYHELAADVAIQKRGDLGSLDAARVKKARKELDAGRPMEVFNTVEGGSSLAETGLQVTKLVEGFGMRRDANGVKDRRDVAGNNEKSRYDNTIKELHTVLTFLEKGYDKLDPRDRTALRERLKHSLHNQRNEVARRHVAGLSEAELNAYLDDVLQSADYANHVRLQLEHVKRLKLTDERQIHKAKHAEVGSTSDVEYNTELTTLTADDLKRAQDYVDAIHANRLPNLDMRAKLLDGELTKLGPLIHSSVTEISRAQDALNNFMNGLSGSMNRQERQTYRQLQNNLDAARADREELLRQQSQIYATLFQLIPSDDQAEQMRLGKFKLDGQAKKAMDTSEVTRESRAAEHQTLLEDRKAEEEAIAGEIDAIFGKALEGKIVTDMQHALEILKEKEPKVQEELTKDVRKEILTHLESRWIRPVTKGFGIFRRRSQDFKLDSQQIRRDYEALLGPNGPTELTRVMAKRIRLKDVAGKRRSLSNEEVNELMKNETFAGEMKGVLIQQILSREMTLRRITPGAIHRIMNTWGREMIDSALNNKNTYRQMVQDLAQTGDMSMSVDNPTFLSRFIRTAQRRPNLLIDAAQTQEEQEYLAHKSAA